MSKTSFSNLTFELIIIFLLPIALITGPAIPDILAVLLGFYFIFQYRKIKFLLSDQYWLHFFFLIWIIFNLNSFFAYDIKLAFTDSLIFIRFFFYSLFIFLFLKNKYKRIYFFFKIYLHFKYSYNY